MTTTHEYHGAVIYTDGGCRPTNPGNTGWGAHGYFYDDSEMSDKKVVAKHHLCTKYGYIHQNEVGQNPRAVLVNVVSYIEAYGSGEKMSSNNSAEMDAVCNMLELACNHNVKEIQILTDSEYVKRGIKEWRSSWEKNGYKRTDGGDIHNKEKWIEMFKLLDIMSERKVSMNIDWVKGHSDIYGNVIADRLATIGVAYTTDGIDKKEVNIISAKEYWKSIVDKHPFINHRRIYFNSQPNFNTPGHYYQADPGKNELLVGKKLPETCYSVVRLKEPDDIIETVKTKQYAVAGNINSVIMLKLDRLYSPDIYKCISEYGDKVLSPNVKGNLSVYFLDRKPITVELNPVGLSLRAIEALSFLDDLLDQYNCIVNDPECLHSGHISVTDITNIFYEKQVVSKNNNEIVANKLKSTIHNGIQSMVEKINIPKYGKTISVPLLFGMDILDRNGLKRIENENPRINLLTWYESENCISYCVVIETDTGVGIWSNYYADHIFV